MKVEAELLVGVGAVARLLAVSRLTVHNYLKAHRFPHAFQLPTGVWRIPITDVETMRRDGSTSQERGADK